MRLTLLIALLATSFGASAEGLSLEAGYNKGIDRETLGWYSKPWYEEGKFSITPEYSISRFHSEKGSNDHDVYNAQIVPMFKYRIGQAFVDAGVGPSVFSKARFEGKQLSTAYQFSDNIGAGYRFQNGITVGYRYTHFSNADIKTPNPGLETQQVYVVFPFK